MSGRTTNLFILGLEPLSLHFFSIFNFLLQFKVTYSNLKGKSYEKIPKNVLYSFPHSLSLSHLIFFYARHISEKQ